jgi:hypothetical protein
LKEGGDILARIIGKRGEIDVGCRFCGGGVEYDTLNAEGVGNGTDMQVLAIRRA